MIENKENFIQIIKILSKHKMLDKIILIGSWTQLFYKYLFDNFEPTIVTTDIDFYIPNPKRIKTDSNVINSFKAIKYDLYNDFLNNKTTLISDTGFEIEFITSLNREGLKSVTIGNTGIYAESLSYVDLFSWNYIQMSIEDMVINVASPVTYVIQKILINKSRGEKSEKDIESVKNVLFYIGASNKYIDEMETIFNELPRRWKRKILETCEENKIILPFLK